MNKIGLFFLTTKKYFSLVFFLGCAYASIITFPAFGPILQQVGGNHALWLGTWTMFFLTVGFAVKPGLLSKQTKETHFLLLLGIFSAILTALFAFLPFFLKWFSLAVLGLSAGRLAVCWSGLLQNEVPPQLRGQVTGGSLFIAYSFLYLANVFVPAIPMNFTPSIAAILILTASITLYFRKAEVQNFSKVKNISSAPNFKNKEVPWILFILIFGVYITAGITYAGIYPQLSQYNPIERYYNVLPFIIAIVYASRIADSKGRKPLLYIGISFLGLSFVFYSMTPGLLTYFLIQTTLQPAWAFLDLFAWVILADIASKAERPEYHHYGLSLIMAGVMFGSFLSIKVVNLNFFTPTLYSFIAHLPLFMAVALLGKIPETLRKDNITPANEYNITELNYPFLQQLTAREHEIIVLLLDNLTNPQICELLSISANTLKTHLRNIYRKTETSNKKDLRTILLEEIQGDPRVFCINSTSVNNK